MASKDHRSEHQIRPLLVKRCYKCHGDVEKPKGGLRLDSRAAMLRGGDTDPAIIPGNAKESLLVDAINFGDLYDYKAWGVNRQVGFTPRR